MPVQPTMNKVRGINVRILRHGTGDPLIYLHGAAGLPTWLPMFELLAAKYEVIVPEHPGFGLSDNPPWIRNIADLAMYYLDFLDALGVDKVHLAGQSLGGWTSAEIATRNCSRLRSLTLIAPAGVRVKGIISGDNFIWSPEEYMSHMVYDQELAKQLSARVPTDEEADIALTNRFAAAKYGWEPRWFNPALERWLHRISVPTLVLWGENDLLFPKEYSEVWGKRIPNCTVEIIPQCGHMMATEKGEVAAQRMIAFLGRS